MSTGDRYAQGLEHLRKTQGEKVAGRIEEALRSVSPSFAEYSISSTYGEVFPRERLELRSRQLVTIAILATLGGCEQQLKLHIRAGLQLGITGDEIVETIIQVAAYAGAPRASNAFLAATEVFERAGVSVA
jgi:4-carboxymuconolactone decarboxylase